MRRRTLVAIAAGSLVIAGGAAYAYTTAVGSGTGSSVAGTMQTVTISASPATPTTPLLPGQSGDATFKVTNPNAHAVTLVSVVASGSLSVTGGSGCNTANSGVTFANQTSLTISIAANASAQIVDLAGAYSMSSTSANGCQGTTFSMPITITVHQP
jgi:hypothetical protein